MQLINKNTDYAIRALLHLAANKKEYISSRQIASELKIPLQFIRRLLQELVSKKYMISKEGIGGGFRIGEKYENINLSEIIKLFQGNIQLSSCMFRKKICPQRSICVLKKRINDIEDKVTKEFENLTIGTLLNDMEVGI